VGRPRRYLRAVTTADRARNAEPVAPAAALPPRALIVSLFGMYARESGGWLSVGTLIKLMARLGADETAVRSSISRLKRRGVIEAERVDGRAGYTIGEHARRVLDLGDRRIFEQRRAALSDGWLLAVFSVPEPERDKRHLLRSRLAWLGFGTVSSGIWIAPKHLEEEAREVLTSEGFADYVDLFHADHHGFGELATKVSMWWNLDELDELYSEFARSHAEILDDWQKRGRKRADDPIAFADYIRTLTTWRRLPYLDPGLPAELLPPRWAGAEASATFHAVRQRLETPAHRFVDSIRDGN
jgi:phenylacetic acid degradation operon negative regulatory protein